MKTYIRQNEKYIEEKVYVIGNGISRESFDLNSLNNNITIGCNIIYKEYMPTKIASICRHIISDIIKEGPLERLIITEASTRYIRARQVLLDNNCVQKEFKYDYLTSGNFAVHYALKTYRPKNLYLIGFDNDTTNLYYGHDHYNPEKGICSTDWDKNWQQLKFILGDRLYKREE